MVWPGAASAASLVLTRILINSGELRYHVQPVTDRGALRFSRALLRRGGVAIFRSRGSFATLHHGRGGLVLTLGKDSLPLLVSALPLHPGGSDLWRWLMASYEFFRANVPGYQTANPPVEPGEYPMAATLDLPVLAGTVSPQMARGLRELAGELGVGLAFGANRPMNPSGGTGSARRRTWQGATAIAISDQSKGFFSLGLETHVENSRVP
jgi:hypothetical protein